MADPGAAILGRPSRASLLLGLLCALSACERDAAAPSGAPASADDAGRASADDAGPRRASIGQATMRDDGTIVLDLRAEGPGGAVGDARLVYPPSHKDYKMILDHLGGIRPGENKPVAPFP